MKIIDAFWEKRNLGCDTLELLIDEMDSMEEINSIQSQIIQTPYVVAKVPPSRFDIALTLYKLGFVFIETLFLQLHDLKNIKLNGIFDRLDKQITYKKMDEQDIAQLFTEIRKNIFKTDRIYLDPHFKNTQAADRYIYWIQDELARGTELFNIRYKDNKIGFFTFKEIGNNVYYPFLAGLYEQYKESGMGFSIIQKPLAEAKVRNGKLVSTYVSSNNMPIFKLHAELGFKVKNMQYILVRHM